jgi:hypothetical protein
MRVQHRIQEAPVLNLDSAVGDGHLCTIECKPGGAKTQKRKISMPSMVLGTELAIFSGSAEHWRLQAATSRRLIVFAPEDLPLDRCVTVNCRIRVEPTVDSNFEGTYSLSV